MTCLMRGSLARASFSTFSSNCHLGALSSVEMGSRSVYKERLHGYFFVSYLGPFFPWLQPK